MSDKIQLIPPGIREVIHLRYMKNAAWKRKLPLIVVIVLIINNLLSLKVFAGEENSAKIVRVGYVNFENYQEGRENFYIYTMPDQEIIDPYELETLNGQRIGVTANSYQQGLLVDWLEENGYDCTVVEYNGFSATADALASGMAVYDKKTDHTVGDVFARADEAMYVCKKQMKKN